MVASIAANGEPNGVAVRVDENDVVTLVDTTPGAAPQSRAWDYKVWPSPLDNPPTYNNPTLATVTTQPSMGGSYVARLTRLEQNGQTTVATVFIAVNDEDNLVHPAGGLLDTDVFFTDDPAGKAEQQFVGWAGGERCGTDFMGEAIARDTRSKAKSALTTSAALALILAGFGSLDTSVAPTLTQDTRAGNGANPGLTLTVRAQRGQSVAAGDNNRGGDLDLSPGLPGAGGNQVAEPGAIYLGVGNRSQSGMIRCTNPSQWYSGAELITVRNSGNTADITVVRVTTDTLFFGDSSDLTGMFFEVKPAGTFSWRVQTSTLCALSLNSNTAQLTLNASRDGFDFVATGASQSLRFAATGASGVIYYDAPTIQFRDAALGQAMLWTLASTGTTSLAFSGTVTSPQIIQTLRAGNGANVGANMSITAQQGQAVAGGTNNNGGELILSSGIVGTGGTGGLPGAIRLRVGTSEVFQGGNGFISTRATSWFVNDAAGGAALLFSLAGSGATSMAFGASVTTPTIVHTILAGTGATAGREMLVQAQQGQLQSGGTNNAGGMLTIRGGAVGTGGSGGLNGAVRIGNGALDTLTIANDGAGLATLTAGATSTKVVANAAGQLFWVATDQGTYIDGPAIHMRDVNALASFAFTLNSVSLNTITAAGTVTGITWNQTTRAGTGTNVGATMTFTCQAGQQQTGGAANNNGGHLVLATGAAGTGGSGAAAVPGTLQFSAGAQLIQYLQYTPSGGDTRWILASSPVPYMLFAANGAGQLLVFQATAGNVFFDCPVDVFRDASAIEGMRINVASSGTTSIEVAATCTAATLFQAKRTGTGVTASANLSILAQDGRNVSGGTNNNGGHLVLGSGDPGTGGSGGGEGSVYLMSGQYTILGLTADVANDTALIQLNGDLETIRIQASETNQVIYIIANDSGSLRIDTSKFGAFDATPVTKRTLTGSRGGNAAVASIATALAELGFVTDSTSA